MGTPKDRQVGSVTSSAPKRYPEHNDSVDENTSLLNPGRSAVASEQHEEVDESIPIGQILLLSYSRIVESIAFWSIFPYISQMIQDNGNIPDSDIGFYSGIVEATLALTQTFTSIPWGRAADRIGRKPCMVISLVGVTFGTALFGMTKTIPQMILFRFITGIFTGTMVTIRTMFADLSTEETEAEIQVFFSFSGSLGIFIGPVVGGLLANPASQYPAIFGGVAFFENYPYALSSLAVAFGGATSALLNLFYLKETLPKPKAPSGDSESGDGSNAAKSQDSMGTWELLKADGVLLALGVYSIVMVLNFAYSAIVPVSLYTPVRLGGYGWSPHQISLMMGLNGAAQAAWLTLVFKRLKNKFGIKPVMRLCSIIYPLYYLSFPIGNFLLRQETKFCTTVFWIFFPLAVVVGSGGNMALPGCNIAVNKSAPSPQLRGTVSGIALSLNGVLKTASPVLFSTLFALGARTQLAGGYAIWSVFVVLTLCFGYAVKQLPNEKKTEQRRQ